MEFVLAIKCLYHPDYVDGQPWQNIVVPSLFISLLKRPVFSSDVHSLKKWASIKLIDDTDLDIFVEWADRTHM